jgi:hypothetical protein
MKSYLVREDIEQWNPLVQWLESRTPQAAAATQPPAGDTGPAGGAEQIAVAEEPAPGAEPLTEEPVTESSV